jgi:hypothetical protein
MPRMMQKVKLNVRLCRALYQFYEAAKLSFINLAVLLT